MNSLSPRKSDSSDQSSCCDIDIKIESQGDVNIYNCAAPGTGDQSGTQEECPPCQTAQGACVPLGLGAKPKQSRQAKLHHLLTKLPSNSLSTSSQDQQQQPLSDIPIPSALAASYVQLSRRFLQGKAAANPLEEKVFSVLRTLPPDLKGILACAVDSFDSLSQGERDQLFETSLTSDVNTPIDPGRLGEAVGQEVVQRASQLIFGDPAGVEAERPGLNRFFEPSGEIIEAQLRICRVNGLRTIEFVPPLGPGDYKPEELQQHCEPVLVNGKIELNCEVQIGNCPGNFLTGDICLRVPEVQAGTGVVLEGVNYISVDTKVRLTALPPGTATVDVDAHVVGDLDTPLTEKVNGTTVTIRDCRVHDRMTFRVPDDLAPGIYTCQIVMPNVSGIPVLGDPILSNPQFLQVIPPDTARFQIALDTLTAKDETSPAFFGSDEVGLSVMAAALLADGTTTSLQVLKGDDGKDFIRIDDVDSGDSFPINRVLFTQPQSMIAVALSINGYEVDSEDAFEKQVKSSMDIFLDLLEKEWDFIKSVIDKVGGFEKLKELGTTGFIVLGIAALITIAIDIIIALWAPADPIIHDALGFTTVDLSVLTSANFPAPSPTEFNATEDISVKMTPVEKVPLQYREQREYHSDDEDSNYDLVLRYNRIA